MKRQRLFCRRAAVVAQVVVDEETHLQLSMTAIDGGEGQLRIKGGCGRPGRWHSRPTSSSGNARAFRALTLRANLTWPMLSIP